MLSRDTTVGDLAPAILNVISAAEVSILKSEFVIQPPLPRPARMKPATPFLAGVILSGQLLAVFMALGLIMPMIPLVQKLS